MRRDEKPKLEKKVRRADATRREAQIREEGEKSGCDETRSPRLRRRREERMRRDEKPKVDKKVRRADATRREAQIRKEGEKSGCDETRSPN